MTKNAKLPQGTPVLIKGRSGERDLYGTVDRYCTNPKGYYIRVPLVGTERLDWFPEKQVQRRR